MKACDLCGLDVGVKPFMLRTPDETLEFCCEGCLGIYQMLYDIKEISADPTQNDADNPQRSTP